MTTALRTVRFEISEQKKWFHSLLGCRFALLHLPHRRRKLTSIDMAKLMVVRVHTHCYLTSSFIHVLHYIE